MMVWHCHVWPSLKPATAITKSKKRPAKAAVNKKINGNTLLYIKQLYHAIHGKVHAFPILQNQKPHSLDYLLPAGSVQQLLHRWLFEPDEALFVVRSCLLVKQF